MIVLDASALLAWLFRESNWQRVDRELAAAHMSTVNLSEVLVRAQREVKDTSLLQAALRDSPLVIDPFTVEDAETAARFEPLTRAHGLSLGDRACLALGLRLAGTVITTDRSWKRLALPITIEVIR